MALVRYIHLNPLRVGLVSESAQLVMCKMKVIYRVFRGRI